MWLWAVGCAVEDRLEQLEATGRPATLELVGEPALELPEGDDVWLAYRLVAQTAEPAELVVTIDDGEQLRELTVHGARTEHAVPLLGLLGDVEHHIEASFRGSEGAHAVAHLTVRPAVPSFLLPRTTLLTHQPARTEPGYTVLPLRGANTPRLIVAYDALGRPRWIHRRTDKLFAVTWHEGRITALNHTEIVTLDPLGDVLHRWQPGEVDDFHHEAFLEPDGSIWTLAKVPRQVDAYPLAPTHLDTLAPARIADERALHLGPDGRVLHQIDLSSVLATRRVGFHSHQQTRYGFDWAHANAVWPVPDGSGVLVSSRHQDAVVKVDRATGEAHWILGPPGGWPASHQPHLLQPIGEPFAWAYHQHAPVMNGARLLLFDNGTHGRRSPYLDEPSQGMWSRVVEYTIDEGARTVEQTFSWGEDLEHPLYSQALGNVDYLPGGTLFATFPYLHQEEGVGHDTRGWGDKSMRLIELDRDAAAPVWDLRIYALASENPDGWFGDRATRVPTLYGPDVTERIWR